MLLHSWETQTEGSLKQKPVWMLLLFFLLMLWWTLLTTSLQLREYETLKPAATADYYELQFIIHCWCNNRAFCSNSFIQHASVRHEKQWRCNWPWVWTDLMLSWKPQIYTVCSLLPSVNLLSYCVGEGVGLCVCKNLWIIGFRFVCLNHHKVMWWFHFL